MAILNMVTQWWGNIWEPLNLTVTSSWLDATITWEDNEIWTIPPTSFQKSELVRKIGSAPTSPSDWTLVVTETVKDTYKTTWYVDQWLTNWETYYYRVFSYSDLWWISYCDAVNVTINAWWQPWANTICYFPLTSDLLDASWKGYSLTASGSATIWSVDWISCLDCSAANSYVLCVISWIPQGNQSRTNMCWVRYTLSGNYPLWQYGSNSVGKADIIYRNKPISWSQYWNWVDTINATTWVWYHVAVTTSWSTAKVYINWELKDSWSMTINTDWTTLFLWRCTWDNSYGRAYYWDMIIEDKAWTDQEIADYYNLTKSNYGL